ncbi:hypothetical protein [Candidatus Nitronereus thalassa]|uniref:Uncharacterized protein n=1 Tax=Candidatus Nitronereus thalassa TaxID=3020898 RepID=A0ABU3K2X7_9BACT|nr:hypothetical protein [Candidatus Nitronereus thalassa]MDT7040743.1 hypothetical protein [Candidatus Nitronereus thalassa]
MFKRLCLSVLIAGLALGGSTALAEDQGQQTFNAHVTDVEGIETTIENAKLYWEEKLDETSFVPHEIRHVPVKRGKATVKIKLQNIKRIDVAPDAKTPGTPLLTITLTNGKSGEFPVAREMSLIGMSDFGDIKVPFTELKRIEFQ